MRRLLATMFCGTLLAASGGLHAQTPAPAPVPRPAAARPLPDAEWLFSNPKPVPGAAYEKFFSNVLGHEVSYLLYLPPDYQQQRTRRYPVIYWLHGMRQLPLHPAQAEVPRLEKAIQEGTVPSVIVVFVNGMMAQTGYMDCEAVQIPMESVIIKDLIPYIDKTWRTIPKREARVIEGFSMGGFGTSHLGFKYTQLFGTVIINAGALAGPGKPTSAAPIPGSTPTGGLGDEFYKRVRAEGPFELARKNADTLRRQTHIRIQVGSADKLISGNNKMHELLGELKIDHEYEVVPGVDHNVVKLIEGLSAQSLQFLKQSLGSVGDGQAKR